MIKFINSNKVSSGARNYSHGIVINNIFYLSQQLGINLENQSLADDFSNQARQTFRNIRYILEAAKSKLNRIIKLVVYLKDINDLEEFNQIYKSIFISHQPTVSIIVINQLIRNALIAIDVVAIVKR